MASSSRWINLLETVKYLEVLSRLRRNFSFDNYTIQEITSGTLKPENSSWCEMRSQTPNVRICRNGSCTALYQKTRLTWRVKIYPVFCKFCAALLSVASAMILWSEMTMAIDSLNSPVGLLLNHLSDSGAGIFMVQFFAFLALAYMSVCVYWAMFSINLGWAFTLQSKQQSPATSLLFNATYLCRLQFSLAFNFLLMLNYDSR